MATHEGEGSQMHRGGIHMRGEWPQMRGGATDEGVGPHMRGGGTHEGEGPHTYSPEEPES